jgi:hypothetical protein
MALGGMSKARSRTSMTWEILSTREWPGITGILNAVQFTKRSTTVLVTLQDNVKMVLDLTMGPLLQMRRLNYRCSEGIENVCARQDGYLRLV